MPATKNSPAKKGPVERLTNEWPSKSGRDVKVKDRIKTAEDVVIDVIGRWTRRTKQGNVPYVTGTTADGTRKNSPAADCTHVK